MNKYANDNICEVIFAQRSTLQLSELCSYKKAIVSKNKKQKTTLYFKSDLSVYLTVQCLRGDLSSKARSLLKLNDYHCYYIKYIHIFQF